MSRHAVIFDLDGTLLDTLEDLADSANAALRELGFAGHPLESYKIFIGDGIENLIRRALPQERLDPATLAHCHELVRSEYSRRWSDKTGPYPGVPELLDALAARGVPMGVLSNKPHEFTSLCVTRLLPGWHFDAVQGATPALPRKPDPAGAWPSPRNCGPIRPKSSIWATRIPTCGPPSLPRCFPSAHCGAFGRRKNLRPTEPGRWPKRQSTCSRSSIRRVPASGLLIGFTHPATPPIALSCHRGHRGHREIRPSLRSRCPP